MQNSGITLKKKFKKRKNKKSTLMKFIERSSRKTVSFEEQIMSKDKIISECIFVPNGDYRVNYPSCIFGNTHIFLKIGEYHSDIPQF